MKLDLELNSVVDELIEHFAYSPEKVSKAIARSNSLPPPLNLYVGKPNP